MIKGTMICVIVPIHSNIIDNRKNTIHFLWTRGFKYEPIRESYVEGENNTFNGTVSDVSGSTCKIKLINLLLVNISFQTKVFFEYLLLCQLIICFFANRTLSVPPKFFAAISQSKLW